MLYTFILIGLFGLEMLLAVKDHGKKEETEINMYAHLIVNTIGILLVLGAYGVFNN